MYRRLLWVTSLMFLAALVSATPALAGNWATITLDQLPSNMVAGQPFEIGFLVLQHGNSKTPMAGLSPTVKASPSEGGQTLTFLASEVTGATGQYRATLELPQAVVWSWSIQAFTMDQPMPALTVSGEALPKTGGSRPLPIPLFVGLLGVLGFAAGLVLALKRRFVWFGAFALAGLGFAVAGLRLASAQPAAQVSVTAPETPSAQSGHDLFVAKGCVACHVNRNVDRQYTGFSTEIGPDLTDRPLTAEYLRMWLEDPLSVKPKTVMPNLHLSQSEIEALIVFLTEP